MKKLLNFIKKIEPEKGTVLHTLYDGVFTLLFTPDEVTSPTGVHIRDRLDLKRTMVCVVLARQLCYVFGSYNSSQQHFLSFGMHTGFLQGFHVKLAYGLHALSRLL